MLKLFLAWKLHLFISPSETKVFHNFPSEFPAGYCERSRCAKHEVIYDIPMAQIIALIEQSTECRQYVKVTMPTLSTAL